MYSKLDVGQEKCPSLATYRRYVSKMSWCWQDLHAVYPISPANSHLGIHRAIILPRRVPFPVRDPQIMHSAHILPTAEASNRPSLMEAARNAVGGATFLPLWTSTLKMRSNERRIRKRGARQCMKTGAYEIKSPFEERNGWQWKRPAVSRADKQRQCPTHTRPRTIKRSQRLMSK